MKKPEKRNHKDKKFIIENAKKQRAKAERKKKQQQDEQPKEQPKLQVEACSTREIAAQQTAQGTSPEIQKHVGYMEMVADLQAACDRSVAETEAASKPSLLRRVLNFFLGRSEKTQPPCR